MGLAGLLPKAERHHECQSGDGSSGKTGHGSDDPCASPVPALKAAHVDGCHVAALHSQRRHRALSAPSARQHKPTARHPVDVHKPRRARRPRRRRWQVLAGSRPIGIPSAGRYRERRARAGGAGPTPPSRQRRATDGTACHKHPPPRSAGVERRACQRQHRPRGRITPVFLARVRGFRCCPSPPRPPPAHARQTDPVVHRPVPRRARSPTVCPSAEAR